jgi:hypothetical protein
VPSQPGEPGSHQQRADGLPWVMAAAQGRRDGVVAARCLTTLPDPLHRGAAPVRGEAELS